MKKREFPLLNVTKKAQASIEGGHPWVYDTEVLPLAEPIENGCLVDVAGPRENYLGTGIYSEKSKIRVRILSRNANDRFDRAFFERRIKYAWDYRKTVMADDISACRVIFGEADHFPGLTVDRFNDVLVTQTLSVGMERLKDIIFPLLLDVLRADVNGNAIRGIYERNDVAIRALEGLSETKGWYMPQTVQNRDTVCEIVENGIRYKVDFENGQKTGYFLDQKYNRAEIARLCRGRRVLDCFTHTGSFALNAAAGGAQSVCAVDISEDAIKLARDNAALNGLGDKIDFRCENVFDMLHKMVDEGCRDYDFIILDPPAFTKSRKTVDSATRGYKEINYRAMKLLPRGGYLATCSCSHFMESRMFSEMLRAAASDAAVELRQIEVRQQSPDHPIVWGVPETDYLKFYIFQIV